MNPTRSQERVKVRSLENSESEPLIDPLTIKYFIAKKEGYSAVA